MVVRARLRVCRSGDPLRRSVDDRSGAPSARLPRGANAQRVLDPVARVALVRRRALRAAGHPIRGSAMSPIPKTAPFADDEIEALNRVVAPATPIQRAWLAGFLAGLDAQTGGAEGAVAPDAASQKAEPLTILYATESGNSEKLAGDVAKAARKLGFKPALVD